MTGLLSMFGLLPTALSADIDSETQEPLAVVVISGLVSETIVTLTVLSYRVRYFERRYYHGNGSPRRPPMPRSPDAPVSIRVGCSPLPVTNVRSTRPGVHRYGEQHCAYC
jgi:hypothetical protein